MIWWLIGLIFWIAIGGICNHHLIGKVMYHSVPGLEEMYKYHTNNIIKRAFVSIPFGPFAWIICIVMLLAKYLDISIKRIAKYVE